MLTCFDDHEAPRRALAAWPADPVIEVFTAPGFTHHERDDDGYDFFVTFTGITHVLVSEPLQPSFIAGAALN